MTDNIINAAIAFVSTLAFYFFTEQATLFELLVVLWLVFISACLWDLNAKEKP